MNSLSCLRAGCGLEEAWDPSAARLASAESPGLLGFLEDSDVASWEKRQNSVIGSAWKPLLTCHCEQDPRQSHLTPVCKPVLQRHEIGPGVKLVRWPHLSEMHFESHRVRDQQGSLKRHTGHGNVWFWDSALSPQRSTHPSPVNVTDSILG